jgi:putative ABC transport system substrate-binding protein
MMADFRSVARLGGNVTGMSGVVAELSSKLVEFVRDLLPLAHMVAVLANAPHPFSKPFLEQLRLAGSATGVEMDPVRLRPVGIASPELDASP